MDILLFLFIHLGFWSMCVFMIVLVETILLISSWNLVTLTLNRYIAVTNPTLCKKLFSWKRSLCAALLIWILSFILNCFFYIEPQPGTAKNTDIPNSSRWQFSP